MRRIARLFSGRTSSMLARRPVEVGLALGRRRDVALRSLMDLERERQARGIPASDALNEAVECLRLATSDLRPLVESDLERLRDEMERLRGPMSGLAAAASAPTFGKTELGRA